MSPPDHIKERYVYGFMWFYMVLFKDLNNYFVVLVDKTYKH